MGVAEEKTASRPGGAVASAMRLRSGALLAVAVLLVALTIKLFDPLDPLQSERKLRFLMRVQADAFTASWVSLAVAALAIVATIRVLLVGGGKGRSLPLMTLALVGLVIAFLYVMSTTSGCVEHVCTSSPGTQSANWILFYLALVGAAVMCRQAMRMSQNPVKGGG